MSSSTQPPNLTTSLPPECADRRAGDSYFLPPNGFKAVGAPEGLELPIYEKPPCTNRGVESSHNSDRRPALRASKPAQPALVCNADNSSTSEESAGSGALAKRLDMLDTAARLVHDSALDDLPVMERLRQQERIEHCTRLLTYGAGAAALMVNAKHQTNSFYNVQHCDSWACPYCSTHKAEEEKSRLQVGMAEAMRQGLYPLMVTLTMRHKRGDELRRLLDQLYDAKNSMFTGRFFADFKERYGIIGHNRYTEITVGPNGHHAHFHLLFFCRWEFSDKEAKALQLDMAPRWLRMLEKHGAAVPTGAEAVRLIDEGRPLHVQPGNSKVVEYLAKMGKLPAKSEWGVEDELASAPAKKGRKEGFTPFELLALASGDKEARAEAFAAAFGIEAAQVPALAGKFWLEYYEAIQGRRMVDWGKGLLELFRVDEQLQALAEQEAGDTTLVLMLIDYVQLRQDKALYLQVRGAGDDVAKVINLLDLAGLHYERVNYESSLSNT